MNEKTKDSTDLELNALARQHRKYQDVENIINEQLDMVIARRRIGVRPMEIYTAAKISRPTFYSHCDGCDDAMKKYEKKLETEFLKMLVNCTKTYSVFTFLLVFIKRHGRYFEACFMAKNFYILHKLIAEIIKLVEKRYVDGLSYHIHIWTICAIIEHWYVQMFSQETLRQHVQIIMRTFGKIDKDL